MTTATQAPTTPAADRSPLASSTVIMLLGQLAWLGVVWLVATVIYAIVVASVARWGTVDRALWPSVAGGWQRWVIFAAGVTVVTTFLRMLVRNGVTRRTMSYAATAVAAVIAVLLSIWMIAGYAIERVVYEANDWPHTLGSETVFTWGDLPRIGIETALIVATYYVVGWIVGACFYRWGPAGGLVRLLPALAPVALIELVVSPDFGGADIDVVQSWRDQPPLLVTALAGAAVVAAAAWVAHRLTREIAVR